MHDLARAGLLEFEESQRVALKPRPRDRLPVAYHELPVSFRLTLFPLIRMSPALSRHHDLHVLENVAEILLPHDRLIASLHFLH